MKAEKLFSLLLLLLLGGTINTFAQNAVAKGSQVTSESSLVSGKPYLVYYVGNASSGYMKDTGSAYTGKDDDNATTAAVYYFTDNGDGTWQVKNYYTGNYWGTPTANANTYIGADEGGSWTLNFLSGGNIAPSCNEHSWNRTGSNIHPWSSGTANVNQLQVWEITQASEALSDFAGYDIVVGSTAASSLSTEQWYVMSQRTRTSYVYEDASSHTLKHTLTKPSRAAGTYASYCVRLVSGSDGNYYLQTGLGNYVGQITARTNVPTTALPEQQLNIGKIASTDGHFYVQCASNNVILDANDFTNGDPSTVVGYGTTVPSSTGGNNDWAFYPVDLEPSWVPTAFEVYTINNTNSNRGALIYNPDASTKWVWSSGKSGTFNASNANCQWVFYPTGTDGQYYLYNVGASKFAVPSSTSSTASWVFSSNAVAVTLIRQSDDTYKIKTATTDTYVAVSNGYTGPVINYNDAGGNFTITLVSDADQSTAVTAAVGKLVDNKDALTAVPASDTDGWYVIRIKTHSTYADKYVYPANPEITYNSTAYGLTFEHGFNVRPAIDDVTYYTRISNESGTVYWQLPNGKYLYGSGNKFPIPTYEKQSFAMDYTTGSGFCMWGSSRYAVPYLLSSQYFIGETASSGNAYYDIYPIDLADAGLTAWTVTIENGSASMQLTCTRLDVSGLTSVYDNGTFFLPTDVTPTSGDFSLDGMSSCSVDATNHTITATFDPNLAIVADDVTVEQGWQTAGRSSDVYLLRVTASPFNAATGASLTVSLKDGTESQISALTLYEASSSSPEVLGTGSGTPTKTQLSTTTIDGSSTTATLSIGSLSLSPAFSAGVTEYAATTTNATNTVSATATDESATVSIYVNGTQLASGGPATWVAGTNDVSVVVTNGMSATAYHVAVTKS